MTPLEFGENVKVWTPGLVLNIFFFLLVTFLPFELTVLYLSAPLSSHLFVAGGGIHGPMAGAPSTAAGPQERPVCVCPWRSIIPV